MSRVLVSGLFFLSSLSLTGQNAPHPAFRHYTTDDGLASSEVYYILQDKEGYIWISTDNGVSRFDGYGFKNFGVNEGLLENVIFVMQLDSLGRVWMQAQSGNLYFLNGDTILPYRHNGALLNYKGRPDWSKGFIVEGAGETVHIATLKYGVITISKNGTNKTYSCVEPFCRQIFEKNGIAINAASQPGGTEEQKVFNDMLSKKKRSGPVYHYENGRQTKFPDFTYSKIEGNAIGAFRLAEGKYFYQLYNDIWFVENGKMQWQSYFPFFITHAGYMKNGKLFVGLHFRQGLRIYDSIEAFRNNEGSTWLPGLSVSYFIEDREGGKWFGTIDKGLFYTPADAFLIFDQETGLPNEKLTALTIKNKNEVFTGLANGEIWHLEQKMDIWTKLPYIPEGDYIRDLHFNRQNQELWASRSNLFYLQKDRWKLFQATYQGKEVSIGHRITESPDGQRLWGSNHRGFMSVSLPKKKAANIQSGYGHRTYVVREDYEGNVWLGQPTGLFQWEDDSLQSRQSLYPAFGLRVEDIALMPDSTLVIATKGGGVVFWKDKQFEQITTRQGLTADMLECIWADENGVLWAGTLNGLNRISGTWGYRQVEQITVFHGLPSNEINRIQTLGDHVWVATSKGLVHFSNKKTSHFSPKPILASVLANNRLLDLTKTVKLRPNQNNLTIGYFAINYKMNGKIPYRYRMDGGDWSTTLKRSLNFPALSPGTYYFEVQAQNEDDVWSESTGLNFEIMPPWWATSWAKFIGAIIILFLGPFIYFYRIRQLKKSNLIQRKISELERSALQAQMNPHFIFNCLNSIQNFILKNEKEAAITYLGKFANLVRKTLHASSEGSISLREEVELLENYMALEGLRFSNRFEYQIELEEGLNMEQIHISPLLVQPFVENAILHGLTDQTAGKIRISFVKKGDYLEVEISDNGKGVSSVDQNVNGLSQRKSLGMSITANRLQLLADSKTESVISVDSITDGKELVCGTIVKIRIRSEYKL